jgi:hypothetical protein
VCLSICAFNQKAVCLNKSEAACFPFINDSTQGAQLQQSESELRAVGIMTGPLEIGEERVFQTVIFRLKVAVPNSNRSIVHFGTLSVD